jgi:hypothetical protein
MHLSGPAEVKPEPDWQQLIRNIKDKYEGNYADRLVIGARVQWYSDQQDWANCAKWFIVQINKDSLNEYDAQQDLLLNYLNWSVIFKWSIDKDQIDAGIKCMEGVIQRIVQRGRTPCNYMDTYANLLYKADRKEEGIQWEEKAWMAAIEWKLPQVKIESFLGTLNKMRNGQPTWPHYISKSD